MIHVTGVMMEINSPEVVEVQIGSSGQTVWVNVNGECRFRAQRIKTIVLTDERCDATPDNTPYAGE